MTEDQFWDFIAAAQAIAHNDLDDLHQQLLAQAEALSNDELIALHGWIWVFLRRSYLAKLWAAAYLVNGGCSDDGFDYFRGWLLAQGKAVFFAAIADPDSLAEVLPQIPGWQPGEELEFEDMLGIASDVFKLRTGNYAPFPAPEPDHDFGEMWDEENDDFYREHLPRLYALMQSANEG
jgi:hypothetical protein